MLRKWVKEFGSDSVQAFPGHGQMKPEQLEIERLRREVTKLKAERPDAAILDLSLAGQWVTPVAEVLRAASVPFILASAYIAADLKAALVLRDAVNAGKSWRPEFLLKALKRELTRT